MIYVGVQLIEVWRDKAAEQLEKAGDSAPHTVHHPRRGPTTNPRRGPAFSRRTLPTLCAPCVCGVQMDAVTTSVFNAATAGCGVKESHLQLDQLPAPPMGQDPAALQPAV